MFCRTQIPSTGITGRYAYLIVLVLIASLAAPLARHVLVRHTDQRIQRRSPRPCFPTPVAIHAQAQQYKWLTHTDLPHTTTTAMGR